MSLLSQLNFTFDPANFGLATNPDGKLQTRLNRGTKVLSTATSATYTTVVAGNISNTTYFVNPVKQTCNSLYNLVLTLYTLFYNVYTAVDDGEGGTIANYLFRTADLTNYYNSITQELTVADNNTNLTAKAFNTYISHTDRLSNLLYTNAPTRPDFNTGRTVCLNIQKIIHETEPDTDDATLEGLGLGCFTSLFIGTELTNHIAPLDALRITAESILKPLPVAALTPQMTTCYNSFINEMYQINNLIVGSRTADENFFVAAQTIAQNVNKVNQLSTYINPGAYGDPVQGYLVDNLVGSSAIQNFKKTS